MKLHHIILLLFISASVITAQDSSSYTFPNLGINSDAPTCQNAQALLTTANSDVARLTAFVNNDLANALKNAQQALTLAQQTCQVQNTLRPTTTLLQTQAQASVSKSRSASNYVLAFRKLSAHIGSHPHTSDSYNTLIASHAKKASTKLNKISTQLASDQSQNTVTLDSVCNDAKSTIQALVNYLTSLNTKVAGQSLKTDLPQRIASLNSVIADCSAPITQTGQGFKKYWGTSNSLAQVNMNYVRTDDITIQFPKPFASVPSVGIALLAFDMYNNYPAMFLDVISTTTTSFVVRVTAPANIVVNQVEFTYIATLSSKSGIYIFTNKIDSSSDADIRAISNQSGLRTIKRSITLPAGLTNPKSLTLLTGINFGKTANNLRLDVTSSADSTQIVYATWADSIFYGASTTTVLWSGDDASTTSKTTTSSVNGILAKAPGDNRVEPVTIDTSAYSAQPEILIGLYHVDSTPNSGFRLSQPLSSSYPKLTVSSTTWADSSWTLINNAALLTCPTIDKSKCKK